jgi:Na+/melibiose symporter-like transporter
MIIGLGIAALQQLSAINAILYYSSLIFQTTGGGRDAALMQAVILGVVNLAFTIVAMFFIDRLGRKPLLIIGLTGIIVAYLMSATAFYKATYKITPENLAKIQMQLTERKMDAGKLPRLSWVYNRLKVMEFTKETAFYAAVEKCTGTEFKP